MRNLWRMPFFVAVALLAIAGPAAWAGAANVSFNPSQVHFDAEVSYERAVLTVSMPGGEVSRQEFDAGEALVFDLATVRDAADGGYRYELRFTPRIDAGLRKALAEARSSGDEAAIARLRAQLPEAPVMSGSFVVEAGSILVPEGKEPPADKGKKSAVDAMRKVTAEDQVIPDDLIVQGSLCVGFDCVNNENFGFDTIRLKENNTRIKFEDTSVGTFPTNDWQLTANDSASGGSSKFSIEDITGAKVPFTVTAGASTNSIFVDSTGRVGFRTSTPVLDLHVATSNTPAIRLEQNNSGGFTAQTWDIAGNEANFFIRDVTGGSRLPFRIRPGAPTSSIDISADGDVGIGTASPDNILTVNVATAGRGITITGDQITDVAANMVIEGDSAGFQTIDLSGGANQKATQIFNDANQSRWRGLNDALNAETVAGILLSLSSGNVGINCNLSPNADLVVDDGAACNAGTRSELNAGDTQFTALSSRTVKEHLAPVKVDGLLEKIRNVNVYSYDFIEGPKGRIGLMAEDFHAIFGRGSDKMINGQEVQLALWLAVQELSARIAELEAEREDPTLQP